LRRLGARAATVDDESARDGACDVIKERDGKGGARVDVDDDRVNAMI